MAFKEEKHVGVWRPTGEGRERIAAILFHEKVEKLSLQPTATNVNLTIPSTIELRLGQSMRPPMLTNLRATISLKSPSVGTIDVGVARDENYYISKTPEGSHEAEFIWRDALAGLIFIEKKRGDGRLVLQIKLEGEICYVVQCKEWWSNESGQIRVEDSSVSARTPPVKLIWEPNNIEVTYPSDAWAKMIQEAFEATEDNPQLALQSLLPFLTGNKQ